METVSSINPITKQQPSQAPVIVCNKLYDVLSSVTEINFETSMKEVLKAIKEYIKARNLFDPLNPSKISCCGDELGAVFGVQEFTIPDVAKFLTKLVFPASSSAVGSCCGSADICKRKSEEVESPVLKKSRTETMVLYLPPSPRSNSLSDSAESYQGYETAVIKDTSDDSFCCSYIDSDCSGENFDILAIEDTFDIEYDVESLSSDSSSFSSSYSDDSDMDTLKSAIITVISKTDSDMEFWADDSSDDDYYWDAESSDSDKWECSECGDMNTSPSDKCQKCFHRRLEWFASEKGAQGSERPKRKNKAKRKRANASKNFNKVVTKEDPPSPSQTDETSVASSSQDSITRLCIVCCERPANGTIVHAHSKYAHSVCCYECARRLQNAKQRCPICRRRIHRVVCSIGS